MSTYPKVGDVLTADSPEDVRTQIVGEARRTVLNGLAHLDPAPDAESRAYLRRMERERLMASLTATAQQLRRSMDALRDGIAVVGRSLAPIGELARRDGGAS